MNLVVSSESRFARTPDGAVWTTSEASNTFWIRFAQVFDQILVVARVRPIDSVPSTWKRVDGGPIRVHPLPHYVGPYEYLKKRWQVKTAARAAIGSSEAIIFRAGSPIAGLMEPMLRRVGRPFGLEIIGNPYDVFAPGAVRHPLSPLFRILFTRQLRNQCARACATAYVTEHELQKHYPPAPGTFTTHFSDIELPARAFATGIWQQPLTPPVFTLVTVGSLAQMYKGTDVLLEAVAACQQRGLSIQLIIVGDGKYRPALEKQASDLGLAKAVTFLGTLPAGDPVREQLDRADLFVLPSRTEGLPRALIEAMARGRPCIASKVGGIPELLSPEEMVPPGDVLALTSKILELLNDPERMRRLATRHMEKAREYSEETLRLRRNEFYRYVAAATERWLQSQKA